MSDPYQQALAFILRPDVEGGFTNTLGDPGGMTNLGVTAKAWARYVGHWPTEAEMRALTPAVVAPFYKANYWTPAHCDQLPAALALCAFDAAVNEGVGHAISQLQHAVNAVADGAFGPATAKALQQRITTDGIAKVVKSYIDCRRAYYKSLAGFAKFGNGWLNRCDAVETAALRMI